MLPQYLHGHVMETLFVDSLGGTFLMSPNALPTESECKSLDLACFCGIATSFGIKASYK